MFTYLRSNPEANYRFITTMVATNMRDHVRNQRPLLTGLDPSNANIAGILADIYMREFACAIHTLQQVNCVAGRYHEHAFDNTDAYIEGQMPTQSHEMNAEQRHAAQLLVGVGNSYSEINATLRMLDSRMFGSQILGGSVSFQSATECNPVMRTQLSDQFKADASFVEDAFDRLHHLVKQVWSLVNMLAFSNLFRFADPRQPMGLPTSEDSIFIPYIPIARQADQADAEEEEEEEVQVQQTQTQGDPSRHVCNDCGKPRKQHKQLGSDLFLCHSCAFKQDYPDEYRIGFPDDDDEDEGEATPQEQPKHFNDIANMLADGKITPEQACSMIETLRDAGIIADDILDPEPEQEQEQQKGFNEIAGLFADWKITTEEACDLFTEWMTECVNASDS
jgi:hypothetical protein